MDAVCKQPYDVTGQKAWHSIRSEPIEHHKMHHSAWQTPVKFECSRGLHLILLLLPLLHLVLLQLRASTYICIIISCKPLQLLCGCDDSMEGSIVFYTMMNALSKCMCS